MTIYTQAILSSERPRPRTTVRALITLLGSLMFHWDLYNLKSVPVVDNEYWTIMIISFSSTVIHSITSYLSDLLERFLCIEVKSEGLTYSMQGVFNLNLSRFNKSMHHGYYFIRINFYITNVL